MQKRAIKFRLLNAYRFSSIASESKGDKVPDVNIMERTPNLTNSSIASPGLKHHQLKVLDALPAI